MIQMALLATLIGCGRVDTDGDCVAEGFPKSGYAGDCDGSGTTSTDAPIADVNWDSDAVVLSITDGAGYDFQFGIVQNDDCVFSEDAEDNDTVCWEGEACLVEDGSTLCHPAGSSGVSLDYTANALEGDADINAGDNTAFPGPAYEFSVTYYLYDTVSEECWVWGLDTSYFTDQNFNCTEAN